MITVDQDKIIVTDRDGARREYRMGSREGFHILTDLWIRSGWETKYVYSFTWLGRPVIQLPEDLIRIQEVIYSVKPDVIIETGVAHGGSLVFYATLCKAMARGRVIGIDIEIRSQNLAAVKAHELSGYITLIEGSSVDAETVAAVGSMVHPGERVLVILDSNHTKQHVLAELHAYSPLVSVGSYIVAADGIMQNLVGAARSSQDWAWNNPRAAAEDFVRSNVQFVIEEPEFPFNEGTVTDRVTYWPSGFLRRRS